MLSVAWHASTHGIALRIRGIAARDSFLVVYRAAQAIARRSGASGARQARSSRPGSRLLGATGIRRGPWAARRNAHNELPALAFRQIEGGRDLICTSPEELSFTSNAFDAVVAGDILQTVPDDLFALREMRRVLKDGGVLCLTVPAYPILWGERMRRAAIAGATPRPNYAGSSTTAASRFRACRTLVASGFVPAVCERIGKNIFSKTIAHYRHDAQPSKLGNAAMLMLLDCERFLIRYINLPVGTRVVCWARKPAIVAERVTVPAWERQWSRPPLPQGTG